MKTIVVTLYTFGLRHLGHVF